MPRDGVCGVFGEDLIFSALPVRFSCDGKSHEPSDSGFLTGAPVSGLEEPEFVEGARGGPIGRAFRNAVHRHRFCW